MPTITPPTPGRIVEVRLSDTGTGERGALMPRWRPAIVVSAEQISPTLEGREGRENPPQWAIGVHILLTPEDQDIIHRDRGHMRAQLRGAPTAYAQDFTGPGEGRDCWRYPPRVSPIVYGEDPVDQEAGQ